MITAVFQENVSESVVFSIPNCEGPSLSNGASLDAICRFGVLSKSTPTAYSLLVVQDHHQDATTVPLVTSHIAQL